jgi:ferredoxin
MAEKRIAKADIGTLLKKLAAEGEVYAPVRNGSAMVWSRVSPEDDIEFEFTNTDLSPKGFVFPQTECLMDFTNDPEASDGMIMKEVPGLAEKRVLLNVRPCDAKALSVLDKVFERDEESMDVYWKDKRDKTAMIGLACKDPCPTCFCSSVNCGPHHEEGLDVLLVDLGEQLLVKPLTERGQQLTADLEDAETADLEAAEAQKQESEAAISQGVSMEHIDDRNVLDEYEHPCFDRIFESCINCGTCTYYCPTCHCFDIQDETQGDYGRRIRTWDSCMSWLFTHHTSGHNPRGSKKDRVRQRFMHKFKYMPIKLEGAIGCVGCGRCTSKCPVNIDVRSVVNSMNEQISQSSE